MSRVRPIHSQNVPRADDSRTLSAPATSTTSSMPLATPYTPLRMASLPVAHAFSMRVTGTSSRPHESAKMPDGKPSVVVSSPNHAASMSARSNPLSTLSTASVTAIGTRSLMPSSKCSPKLVMPAPIDRHAPHRATSARRRGRERVAVVGDARPLGDPAQDHLAAVADADVARRCAGDLGEQPHAGVAELHDHDRVRRGQPGHRGVDGGRRVDGRVARQLGEPGVALGTAAQAPVAGRQRQRAAVRTPPGLQPHLGLERPLVGRERDPDLGPRRDPLLRHVLRRGFDPRDRRPRRR